MLRVPLVEGRDDEAVLREVAHEVAAIYMSADDMKGAARTEFICEKLRAYEAKWA